MSTIIALGIFICIPVFAQTNVTPTPLTSCTGTLEEGCYTLLEPLGGIEGVSVGNANGEGGIGGFMNFIFGIGIGVAGVLGVVMLIIYGFQYASNEQSIRGFTELKEKITSVILGLLLLLGTFILLRTINPDLLLVDPEISGVSFETGGDTQYTGTPESLASSSAKFQDFARQNNIYCPGSGGRDAIPQIARSMVGKITYSMNYRFTQAPSNTWHLDCSGFVHTVYQCAGLPSPGTYTGNIFSKKEGIFGRQVQVGDLIGWVSGENKESYGHVIMYIGDGKTIESTGANKKAGKAILERSISPGYGPRIKYIKPLSN